MCVRINRRDIGRSATLQRPSVGLGNRRRRGLEGRGTRPDSRPDHCLPLGVVSWPPRSREMRRTVCSVEPVFWPMRGMGCAPRVLACCAPEPHPNVGISMRGRDTPAANAPRPARPFRDRPSSQCFAARHHTRAFQVQSGLGEVRAVACGALSRRPPLSKAIPALFAVCCGQSGARLRMLPTHLQTTRQRAAYAPQPRPTIPNSMACCASAGVVSTGRVGESAGLFGGIPPALAAHAPQGQFWVHATLHKSTEQAPATVLPWLAPPPNGTAQPGGTLGLPRMPIAAAPWCVLASCMQPTATPWNPPTGPPLRGPPSAELGTYENASAVQGRFWGPGGVSWQEAPYFLAAPKLCQNKKKQKTGEK